MARKVISLCKLVGTISLGLLTGLSYSVTTTTIPSFLSLPSAPAAQRAAATLRSAVACRRHILSATSALAFSAAFLFAPSRARHPYLLWTAVAAIAAGPGLDYTANALASSPSSSSTSRRPQKATAGNGVEGSGLLSGNGKESGSDDGILVDIEDEKKGEDVNGEEVHDVLERMRVREAWRAGVAGIGFTMAVVGIWGDRY